MAVGRCVRIRELEGGVRQPVPEAEAGLEGQVVVGPVADEDPLAVAHGAGFAGVVQQAGMLAGVGGPGDREAATRIDDARQDVRDGVPDLLAAVPGLHDRPDVVQPRELDGRSGREHDHRGGLGRCDGRDEPVVLRWQPQIRPVEALGLPFGAEPDDDDGEVGRGGGGHRGRQQLIGCFPLLDPEPHAPPRPLTGRRVLDHQVDGLAGLQLEFPVGRGRGRIPGIDPLPPRHPDTDVSERLEREPVGPRALRGVVATHPQREVVVVHPGVARSEEPELRPLRHRGPHRWTVGIGAGDVAHLEARLPVVAEQLRVEQRRRAPGRTTARPRHLDTVAEGVPEPVEDRHDTVGPHRGAPAALVRRGSRRLAEHGDPRHVPGQWQDVVVGEQDHGVGGDPTGEGTVFGALLHAARLHRCPVGATGPLDQPQQVHHLAVEVRDGDGPGGERRFDVLAAEPAGGTRHLEVEAAGDRIGGVRAVPVGHDEPVETELGAQDPVDEGVLGGGGAVDGVVGGHRRPGLRGSDGEAEGFEVDLPEGTLVDPGIDGEPIGLLVVADDVLDARRDPLRLDPLDVGRSDAAGQERVLGEALEVAPGVGHTRDVHRGSEQDRRPVGTGLRTQRPTDLPDELGIERGTHRHTDRVAHHGRSVPVVEPADPVRPVGELHRRHTEPLDGHRRPQALPGQQRDLLVERQRTQGLVDPVTHSGPPSRTRARGRW